MFQGLIEGFASVHNGAWQTRKLRRRSYIGGFLNFNWGNHHGGGKVGYEFALECLDGSCDLHKGVGKDVKFALEQHKGG